VKRYPRFNPYKPHNAPQPPPSRLERRRPARDTRRGGGLGAAVSMGCLHAGETDLRWLMRHVPLGTQVVIPLRITRTRHLLTWL